MSVLDETLEEIPQKAIKLSLEKLSVFYGPKLAIKDVTLSIREKEVTAFIGASGSGKTSLLRVINRMHETIEGCYVTGNVYLDQQNIFDPAVDVVQLRTKVGIVFQKANPFPKSIYDNVAYGPRIHGLARNRKDLDDIVMNSLSKAGLLDEVYTRLHESGMSLSGGQQQRLCIARTIAINPELILMDEPCSALDPIATAKVEELIDELRENYTIVIITHSMQQAARVSQQTAFFHMGELVEMGETATIFTAPQDERTQSYITGRIG